MALSLVPDIFAGTKTMARRTYIISLPQVLEIAAGKVCVCVCVLLRQADSEDQDRLNHIWQAPEFRWK